MIFHRAIYFAGVRKSLFNSEMTQQQVDGQNFKLDVWSANPRSSDVRHLAYCLATSFHETNRTMWPVEEIGKGKGHAYGRPDPTTGHAYYGRGDIQLTWADNYKKATTNLGLDGLDNLYLNPQRALDPSISAAVLFTGMSEGWFTGKRLQQFFSPVADNPVAARAIVNNDVAKNGERIAGYHDKFTGQHHRGLGHDDLH
jgi:hypothetical protein